MVQTIFATKLKMGQAWTKSGKRVPVTRLKVDNNFVVSEKQVERDGYQAFQIGYGIKKLKNMSKPLKTILTKGGFSLGFRQLREVRGNEATEVKVGDMIKMSDVLHVGDIVHVQGTSKGTGFTGVMKRHGFHGGPRTHGQSDRARAPGSIGNRTTPGRVFKGKRMAGHNGNVSESVKNLQVVFIDSVSNEVWVNGPVPGYMTSTVRLTVQSNAAFEGLDERALKKVAQPEVDAVTEPEVAQTEKVVAQEATTQE